MRLRHSRSHRCAAAGSLPHFGKGGLGGFRQWNAAAPQARLLPRSGIQTPSLWIQLLHHCYAIKWLVKLGHGGQLVAGGGGQCLILQAALNGGR